MNKKIAIIGGGNLGSAIAEGLIAANFTKPDNIIVTKRNVATLDALKGKGVVVTNDNASAVAQANYIILAVKPFQIKEILEQLKPRLNAQQHTLVSVITGIWINYIQEIVGTDFTIYRAMPNTAIAIQQSMTCICSVNATDATNDYTSNLFNQLGKTVFIEEKLMDAATVLAACGTAYAMRFIRANIQGGIEIGFSAQVASLIAAQTVKGAAELLLQKNTHPEQEIDKVTTPKGCTIAGLNEMEHQGFSSSLIKGIVTSYKKNYRRNVISFLYFNSYINLHFVPLWQIQFSCNENINRNSKGNYKQETTNEKPIKTSASLASTPQQKNNALER